MPARPSPLQQIADEAGVSKNTASAVLRGLPGYAAATQDRVRAIADRMGYKSNPLVSALMRGVRRSRPGSAQGNLAYLHPYSGKISWQELPFARQLFESARERAETLGFQLDPVVVGAPGVTSSQVSKILRSRGVTGLVIGPRIHSRSRLTLDWKRFAAVTLGFSLLRPQLHRVATNHYHVMGRIFHELRHLGYRRVGVFLTPELNLRFDCAWQAALSVLKSRQPDMCKIPSLVSSPSVSRFEKWFEKYHPEVVVDGGWDLIPLLGRKGIRIPEDIGYVTLTAESRENSEATFRGDWAQLGVGAIDLLTSLLLRGELGVPKKPSTTLIDGKWLPGRSVRRVTRGNSE